MRRTASDAIARAIGARIRAIRLEQGIKQERLAWETDMDKGNMSGIESGVRAPSIGTLEQIADRLGCDVADLVVTRLEEPRWRLLDAIRRGDRAEAERVWRALVWR